MQNKAEGCQQQPSPWLPVAVVNKVLQLNIALYLEHVKQFHLVQRVCRCMSVCEILFNHLHSQPLLNSYRQWVHLRLSRITAIIVMTTQQSIRGAISV